MGKPYAKEGPSAEDKALDLFADMMIERIQSLSGKDGWKKPWFTEGALQWPKSHWVSMKCPATATIPTSNVHR